MKTMAVCLTASKSNDRIRAAVSRPDTRCVVLTVESAPELFMELRRRRVDVALVDFALAVPDPVKFTHAVRARFPWTSVVLTGSIHPHVAATAVAAGANAVLRAQPGQSERVVTAFTYAATHLGPPAPAPTGLLPRRLTAGAGPLSEREHQVLVAMVEGQHNTEIGRNLAMAENTVKTHAKRIYRKLGARDRAHAVAIAFRIGLVA